MSDLKITLTDSPNKNVKIIALEGEMDEQSVEELRKTIDAIPPEAEFTYLVFDLENLEYINSKGIGYLVSVHTHLSKFRKTLILTSAREAVMDVMSLVGLTTIIKHFDSIGEAINNL